MTELSSHESPPGSVQEDTAAKLTALYGTVAGFIQGKPDVIDIAVTCLLAGGHLLLEDVPGVGKTSLARVLAAAAGVGWNRIQFTPDVLPSDVTGVSVWDQGARAFVFHPGPVFASIVLADEINRATPRTQAALLEAMEEHTVSVDGQTRVLPSPFFVIATQNPIEMAGTYPLPEAQVDRFLMRTSIGYPDHEAEVSVLEGHQAGKRVSDVRAALQSEDIQRLLAAVGKVQVDIAVLKYIVEIVASTRTNVDVLLGASPRGSVGLLRASRARALIRGRSFVVPGDVQELAIPVLAHRLVLDADARAHGQTQAGVIARIIDQVPAPQGV